jgi:uncharacterized protein (DUF2384 family)
VEDRIALQTSLAVQFASWTLDMDSNAAMKWFTTPHEEFDGQSPREVIEQDSENGYSRVLILIGQLKKRRMI